MDQSNINQFREAVFDMKLYCDSYRELKILTVPLERNRNTYYNCNLLPYQNQLCIDRLNNFRNIISREIDRVNNFDSSLPNDLPNRQSFEEKKQKRREYEKDLIKNDQNKRLFATCRKSIANLKIRNFVARRLKLKKSMQIIIESIARYIRRCRFKKLIHTVVRGIILMQSFMRRRHARSKMIARKKSNRVLSRFFTKMSHIKVAVRKRRSIITLQCFLRKARASRIFRVLKLRKLETNAAIIVQRAFRKRRFFFRKRFAAKSFQKLRKWNRPKLENAVGYFVRVLSEVSNGHFSDRIVIDINSRNGWLILEEEKGMASRSFIPYASPEVIGWYRHFNTESESRAATIVQTFVRAMFVRKIQNGKRKRLVAAKNESSVAKTSESVEVDMMMLIPFERPRLRDAKGFWVSSLDGTVDGVVISLNVNSGTIVIATNNSNNDNSGDGIDGIPSSDDINHMSVRYLRPGLNWFKQIPEQDEKKVLRGVILLQSCVRGRISRLSLGKTRKKKNNKRKIITDAEAATEIARVYRGRLARSYITRMETDTKPIRPSINSQVVRNKRNSITRMISYDSVQRTLRKASAPLTISESKNMFILFPRSDDFEEPEYMKVVDVRENARMLMVQFVDSIAKNVIYLDSEVISMPYGLKDVEWFTSTINATTEIVCSLT